MRVFRSLSVAGLLVSAAPTAAHAYGSWSITSLCGGSKFATCASMSVTSAAGNVSGVTRIVVQVTNLSGLNGTFGNTIFTQIGLWGLSKNTTLVAGSLLVNGQTSSEWQAGVPGGLSGNGIQKLVFGVDTQHGLNGGLGANSPTTFQFDVTGLGNGATLDDFALHGQAGPNGCSTKLVTTNGSANSGESGPGTYDAACGVDVLTGTAVTPEPAAIIMLGSGALGLLGLPGIRRRLL
jgi:hypothetical protein